MNVLSYKTETNGLPLWRARSSDEGQPHIVRLAAVLCNYETHEVINEMDVIIRPEGWDMPVEAFNSHGITVESAVEVGISEGAAISQFLQILQSADQVISSNKQFNNRIIKIALTRHSTEEVIDTWKNFDSYCVMKMAKDDTGNKSLTFPDAFHHYTGDQIVGNDSLLNAGYSARVFFAINNKK